MENSFAYHLNDQNFSCLAFYLMHGLAILLSIMAMRGSEDRENHALRIMGSFIPFVGIICGLFALVEIIQRARTSGGKCFFGHSPKHTYDSEAEKWKDGRMPLRLSIGGRNEYTCTKCSHKEVIRWKAF